MYFSWTRKILDKGEEIVIISKSKTKTGLMKIITAKTLI